MVELMADMWMYLVGAGLVGLVIGWAFRGAFIPAPKTVNVSPPAPVASTSALTDDEKQRLEDADRSLATVTALEARVKSAQELAADYQSKLTQSEKEIATLKEALDKKDEDQDSGIGAVAAGLAGAVAGAAGAALVSNTAEAESSPETVVETVVENDPKLVWQNRYLASRVRYLEEQIVEPAALSESTEDNEVTKAEDEDNLVSEDVQLAKLEQLEAQVTQLRASQEDAQAKLEQALETNKALEEQVKSPDLASAVVGAVAGAGLATAVDVATEDDVSAKVDPIEVETDEAEKADTAKLTWQNRYLKARVLNLEAKEPVDISEIPLTPSEDLQALQAELDSTKAELSKFADGDINAEKELAKLRWRNRYLEGRLKYLEASSLDSQSAVDVPTDSVAKALDEISKSTNETTQAEPDPEPIEAVSRVATEDEVRPPSLDAPEGDPSDLKIIGGIGPKIEGILNELGVFHYHQVASWSPAEEAWIDSYLRFQGRVMKERWVEQAKALAT